MARVTHICLSDLHLGAETAILTDTTDFSADPLRQSLATALNATLDVLDRGKGQPSQPSLVLLGDIMDFSLGTPPLAISSFKKLLDAFQPLRDRLGPTIFLPGNHDHELWTASRFNAMSKETEAELKHHDHTTRAFSPPAAMPRATIMDDLLQSRHFPGCATFYPNMGLQSPDGKKTVILHHGHFLESTYRVMSTLIGDLDGSSRMPESAEKLEQQNASWIDFFWSNFGDDGLLGKEVRLGYDYLLTGREDIRFDRRLAAVLSDKLLSALPIPQTAVAQQWAKAAVNAMIESLIGAYGQMDRFSYFVPLGADATSGLKSYLSQIVAAQMADEDKWGKDRNLPETREMTFIFGHTHKPFETRFPVPRYDRPPAVYNTGGWDLDMPIFGTRLGGSAVLIDEDLNVASLRLCAVPASEGQQSPPVSVQTADGTTRGNPLAERLENALQETTTLWSHFATEATRAYNAKQAFIFTTMAQADKRDNHDRRAL